jgi:hypothetical protein
MVKALVNALLKYVYLCMGSKTKIPPSKVELVRIMIRAHRSFAQVVGACKYIRTAQDPEKQPWYSSLVTGIIVGYACHFRRSDTMDRLPKEFEEFREHPILTEYHKQVVMARHWAFAHDSPEQAKDLLEEPPGYSFGQIVLKNVNGGLLWGTDFIHWPSDQITHIEVLATYQKERLGPEICRLVMELNDGKPLSPGNHILGVNFPT